MKKLFAGVFTVLMLMANAPLFPAELGDLVGDKAATLRAVVGVPNSALTEVQLKNPQPRLLPAHKEIQLLAQELQKTLQPSIMVESLYLYKKPTTAAAPETVAWTESERLALYNRALALSSLTGIQYYSASRKTMRTFYESSQVIDGADTKKAIPDPQYTAVSPSLTIHARQKDLTFGDNIYRYDYRAYPDAFVFVQENLTSMNAGIIQAVGKNKLRSLIAVIDTGDSLLIYAVSMAKATALPGLGEKIGNSFTNRAVAIIEWFENQANGVLQPR